jgi:hypothetical protein
MMNYEAPAYVLTSLDLSRHQYAIPMVISSAFVEQHSDTFSKCVNLSTAIVYAASITLPGEETTLYAVIYASDYKGGIMPLHSIWMKGACIWKPDK